MTAADGSTVAYVCIKAVVLKAGYPELKSTCCTLMLVVALLCYQLCTYIPTAQGQSRSCKSWKVTCLHRVLIGSRKSITDTAIPALPSLYLAGYFQDTFCQLHLSNCLSSLYS
jgi:hypothetical protein